MTKILTVAPVIRPGGGPGGYAYNLQSGLDKLSSEEKHPFVFEFQGRRDGRTALAEQGGNYKFKAYIKMAIELGGLKPLASVVRGWSSGDEKALRRAIGTSNIVVFHGPFFLQQMQYAARKGKCVMYMPHSPSIHADEYAMMFALNGMVMPEAYRRWKAEQERQCIAIASHVIFPSFNAAQNYFHAFAELKAKSIFYIASGVDTDVVTPKPREPGPVRFLFAGRYVTHKGYDLFCAAADCLGANAPDMAFVTAGSGPLKSESDAITDLGWRSDIFALLGEVDVVVIPNRIAYYDLFPLECAAMGKPMVMTAVGGSIDQLAALPDVVACPQPEPDALVRAIVQAYTKFRADPDWGKQNAAIADAQFTSRVMARSWVARFKEMTR